MDVTKPMTADQILAELLEPELADYVGDDAGWARQAARQAVVAIRLAGWAPLRPVGMIPAEEEREGSR